MIYAYIWAVWAQQNTTNTRNDKKTCHSSGVQKKKTATSATITVRLKSSRATTMRDHHKINTLQASWTASIVKGCSIYRRHFVIYITISHLADAFPERYSTLCIYLYIFKIHCNSFLRSILSTAWNLSRFIEFLQWDLFTVWLAEEAGMLDDCSHHLVRHLTQRH